MTNLPQTTWRAETDLVFPPGSNKLRLTSQRPLVRAVLHEAIDRLRATMLFNNAFPDLCVALGLIQECLFDAAKSLKPGTEEVLERLTNDADYLSKIIPLVRLNVPQCDFTDNASQPRARICLIRSEVKECCTTIIMGPFLAFGGPLDIVDYVRNQLSRYTYTFPKARLVCHTIVIGSI